MEVHHGDSLLLIATKEGRITQVKELIRKGHNINEQNNNGNTALIYSSQYNHLSLVELFIDNGAIVDEYNMRGETALHFAAENGNIEIVKRLIQANASVDLATIKGKTPLHFACWKGHLEVVKLLIEKGATVSSSANNLRTPLHEATLIGNLEIVKELIKGGATINSCDKDKATPLYIAARKGNIKIVEELIINGGNMELSDSRLRTPLHIASFDGKLKVVRKLICLGANVFALDIVNWLPIHFAACQKDTKIVELLLTEMKEKKTGREEMEEYTTRGLHIAVDNSNLEAAKLFIECGADLNDRKDIFGLGEGLGSSLGSAPIISACESGNKEMIIMLMKNGANIKLKDEMKGTLLHWAVGRKCSQRTARMLVMLGINVDAEDKFGVTPLYVAVNKADIKMVAELIRLGAKIGSVRQVKTSKEIEEILYQPKSPISLQELSLQCFSYGIDRYSGSDIVMVYERFL